MISSGMLRSAALSASLFVVGPAYAATCIGNCGTAAPNGDVTAPPVGGPNYDFVSTNGGGAGAGQIGGAGGTNGSQFTTSSFSASAGDTLKFAFNYVTSDGSSSFPDYSFAELLNGGGHVAWLFTARTVPTGDTSPGQGLPTNDSTLSPLSSTIIPSASNWSALGGTSGGCYSAGCGSTGWITSIYSIALSDIYQLRFGVTNFGDSAYDSGLAYAGLTVNDVPVEDVPIIGSVPEPATWAMMIVGFGLAGRAARRRRTAQLLIQA